jgi:cell division protein FtsW
MEAVRERESCDRSLLCVTVFLLLIGTVIVLETSYARAMSSAAMGNDAFFFFKRQLMWAVLSLGTLGFALNFPYWRLRRFWVAGVFLSIGLLVLVLLIGKESGGSKRWLGVGPISFQPSEFAKIAMILFLARYSDLWRSRISNLMKGFVPPVAVVLGIGGLIAKEDLGTAITTIVTGVLMIGMMGARPKHMIGLGGVAVLAGVGLILIEPYRMDRIWGWLDLMANPLHPHAGSAYQPSQGLIALGSGGVYGQGIMRGIAKHLYLPAEHTDYIFATVGEETGFVGCAALLGLFATLSVLGLTIAHRTRDWFGSLLAAGFTCMVAVQALLNIAVVVGIVPCTGVPLPFISYGGSSLVFTTLAMGVVLNISQYPAGPGEETKGRQVRESRPDGWRHRRPHLSRS